MTTPLTTPVAIIAFNRPVHVRAVLKAISEVRPAKIFAIVDGHRPDRPGEAARCLEVQRAFDEIEWPCEVHRHFAPFNLGCKMRVTTGLDWLFGQVDEAIILEDDCLPDASFFLFAEELLAMYRNDPRIGMIAGSNLGGLPSKDGSGYFFSNVAQCWGWATWARAWRTFDVSMSKWPQFRDEGRIADVFHDHYKVKYWRGLLDSTYYNKINTWDYIWVLTLWLAGQLTIIPSSNMIANIGFGDESTHTSRSSHPAARIPVQSVTFPMRHPNCFLVDHSAEKRIHDLAHGKLNCQVVAFWYLKTFLKRHVPRVARIISHLYGLRERRWIVRKV
jgi:hypothetical protein